MKKFLTYLPFIAVVFVVVIMVIKIDDDFSKEQGRGSFSESPMIGKKITELTLENLFEGEADISGDIYEGKITLVNIFASWCTTCILEHPIMLEIAKKPNMQIIGINWRDKKEDAAVWLKQNGNPYDLIGYDELGKYGVSLGIRGVPESFLVNQNGVIIYHIRGNIVKDFIFEVDKIIAKLD